MVSAFLADESVTTIHSQDIYLLLQNSDEGSTVRFLVQSRTKSPLDWG